MDTALYDALKEKLGEEKVKIGEDEKTLLEVVADWEEGVVKTREANKDLTRQREEWEKKEREYKTTITDFNTAKSDLEKQLTELKGKSGNNDKKESELEKKINSLTDQIKTLEELHGNAEKKAQEAEERALKANKIAAEKGLREKIINSLSKYKISGNRAEIAIEAIMAKGLASLDQSESGLYEESFCTVKDGKKLAADVDLMCKWFSEDNPYLVEGSGKPGTGNDHRSSGPPQSGGNRSYLSMIKSGG